MKYISIKILVLISAFTFIQCAPHQWATGELLGKERPVLKGQDFSLRPEAARAFLEMKNAAAKEGINIYSVSSYRDFKRQKGIWERKWSRYATKGLRGVAIATEIIKYSTIPGTSRHHWGTDLDVIDANMVVPGDKLLAQHFSTQGAYSKLHKWMTNNANSYGFYLVYTNEPSRKGFQYEPWHFSYKPLAKKMYAAYLEVAWKQEIKDVMGINQLPNTFFEKYQKEQIEGINPILK